jgi:hypothetical protein
MGKLFGASGQSVYKWESGEARPRAANLPGIAAVRKLGRKDVVQILESLGRKRWDDRRQYADEQIRSINPAFSGRTALFEEDLWLAVHRGR